MSDTSITPEHLRQLCEQLGLQRAFKLYPDAVRAAAERGLRPLGDPPGGHVPIAAPAAVFNPTRFERDA
jgi:hypothetical protein